MTLSPLRKLFRSLFVFCNLAVALLLLAGCYGTFISERNNWISGLLAPASFYLLLALLAFMALWLFTKPRLMWIGIITLIIAWQPLQNIIPFRLKKKFESQKQESSLRVMSWNVEQFNILEHKRNPQGKKDMMNLIRQYNPDVACFQEMVAGDSANGSINYLQEFIRELQMPYYHYTFDPRHDFDKRHHFGIIIFSKYPIIRKKTIDAPPHNYNSVFQYADIVKATDTFRLFNFHLQTLRLNTGDREYLKKPSFDDESDIRNSRNVLAKFKKSILRHEVQADRVRREIDKSPYPVIACGDLNDVPNSYAYKRIGENLQDAFRKKGSGTGRTYNGISPTLRIDYVFCDNAFQVIQYASPSKKLSDHFPLVADLALQR